MSANFVLASIVTKTKWAMKQTSLSIAWLNAQLRHIVIDIRVKSAHQPFYNFAEWTYKDHIKIAADQPA